MAAVDSWLPKVLKKREGAHDNYVSAFDKIEHLRRIASDNAITRIAPQSKINTSSMRILCNIDK
jgi:hypothetical protein